MTRGRWLLAPVALALALCWAHAAAGARVESKHFVLFHESESHRYVEQVLSSLESAYDAFVSEFGFATFADAVEVRVLSGGMDGMGAEYLETGPDGRPVPVIEIAAEASMAAATEDSVVGMTLADAVLSTATHEFFHVLQDYAALNGDGDVAEATFVEPHATAVQELVAPGADDYIDAAVDLFFAPDAMSFFDRGYDAGFFWVYVLDRYGIGALDDVMTASARADGPAAVDLAFAPRGMTALDLWAKFVAAWAADALPDRDARARTAAAWGRELALPDLQLPFAIASAAWEGKPRLLDRVTEESPAWDVLGYSDSAIGAPLKVSHDYGLDVVSIVPRSGEPLEIRVEASTSLDLRIAMSGRRGSAWELLSISERRLVVRSPDRYDEIRVWLTRGEGGTGLYAIRLSVAARVAAAAPRPIPLRLSEG